MAIAIHAAAQTPSRTSCVGPPEERASLLSRSAAGAITNGIFGHVVRVADVRPVQNARIDLAPGGKAVSSDSLGHFQFNDVPNGRYLLRVRAIGYPTVADSITIGADGLVVVAMLEQRYGLREIVCVDTSRGRPPRER